MIQKEDKISSGVYSLLYSDYNHSSGTGSGTTEWALQARNKGGEYASNTRYLFRNLKQLCTSYLPQKIKTGVLHNLNFLTDVFEQ